MLSDVTLLVIGWLLGLLSSLVTSVVSYWLEGRRSIRDDIRRQRREDIRIARNWMYEKQKVSLRGFDLKGANLSGKDLSGADLEQADLAGAQLWGTKFEGTNLREANLRKAHIRTARFMNARLKYVDFTGATIYRADFTGADLRAVKFRQAKQVEECVWASVRIDETTELSPVLQREIERQLRSNPDILQELLRMSTHTSTHQKSP